MRNNVRVGIFGPRIRDVYAARAPLTGPPPVPAVAISSPWSAQDSLVTWTIDQMWDGEWPGGTMTREIAGRIPAVQRAHGIHVTQFAQLKFFQMDGPARTAEQPRWLTTSDSGVSPYHRMFGLGSDLFYDGWGCLGFTRDMGDCLHIPFGMWRVEDDGSLWVDDRVPAPYRARPVAIPLGYGANGLLHDGIDTLREARLIESAYMDRLENPIPLTILGIPREVWDGWTKEERAAYRDQWVEGRKRQNGSTAMKVAEFPVDMPGQVAVDLYESGRNSARLDIANHTATPASMIEGVRQGGSGGGTEMRYTGVANGAGRSELWDFGLAKRFTLAVEARLSLDDISPAGLSIRADLTDLLRIPEPTVNTPSED